MSANTNDSVTDKEFQTLSDLTENVVTERANTFSTIGKAINELKKLWDNDLLKFYNEDDNFTSQNGIVNFNYAGKLVDIISKFKSNLTKKQYDYITVLNPYISIANILNDNGSDACSAICFGYCVGTCYDSTNISSNSFGTSYGETCHNGCGKSCSYACYNTCNAGCSTSCAHNCGANSSALTCTNNCGKTCGTSCSDSCDNRCTGYCDACSGGCKDKCSGGCYGGCSNNCGETCTLTGKGEITDDNPVVISDYINQDIFKTTT